MRSEPSRGSEFHFTLGFDLPAQAAPVAPPRPDDVSACRVLVVDDSAAAREVAQGLLDELGCRHAAVDSAAAALAALGDGGRALGRRSAGLEDAGPRRIRGCPADPRAGRAGPGPGAGARQRLRRRRRGATRAG